MKDTIIKNVAASINVLNTISVNGKQNLANLSGCISLLEDVMNMLIKADFTVQTAKDDTGA